MLGGVRFALAYWNLYHVDLACSDGSTRRQRDSEHLEPAARARDWKGDVDNADRVSFVEQYVPPQDRSIGSVLRLHDGPCAAHD